MYNFLADNEALATFMDEPTNQENLLKMVYYGKLKAKELFLKGIKPNLLYYYLKPLYKFSHSYLIRLGIFDGKKGIIICYLNALSIYIRYVELKRMYKED